MREEEASQVALHQHRMTKQRESERGIVKAVKWGWGDTHDSLLTLVECGRDPHAPVCTVRDVGSN